MMWTRWVYGRPPRGVLSGAVVLVLRFLSVGYRVGLDVRNGWYARGFGRRRHVRGVRVISVGNITVGGSGKTPLVSYILRRLLARGQCPGVVSRGYRAARSGRGGVADEPEMLRRLFPGLPVIIAADRGRGIQEARQRGCTHVVLDDAFQNLSVHKDAEIVCVPLPAGFGNGRLFPAGPLRLPLTWLARAHAVVLTHQGLAAGTIQHMKDELKSRAPAAELCVARYEAERIRRCGNALPLAAAVLKEKTVAVLCGIAFPERLTIQVQQLGGRVSRCFYFPDHHQFSPSELKHIARECGRLGLEGIVTTAKDEVRLMAAGGWPANSVEVYVLDVTLRLESHGQECIDKLCGLPAA